MKFKNEILKQETKYDCRFKTDKQIEEKFSVKIIWLTGLF